jgi:prevent-host-death family protein
MARHGSVSWSVGIIRRAPPRRRENQPNLDKISKLEIFPMSSTRVTASQFQQSFGALSDKARHEPVVITKHGRDSLVVMSAEEWARLKRRDRRVGLAGDLPEEWIEAVQRT